MNNSLDVAAAYWDRVQQEPKRKNRYWQFPQCIRAINQRMGYDSDQWSGALIANLRAQRVDGFKKAISIGCGAGSKELEYLKAGIADHFDLYEISEARVAQGRSLYARAGMATKGRFLREDGFASLTTSAGKYDLVLWDNSLHHMPNPKQALIFSLRALRPGGALVFNEYVGPNRFQWTAEELEAMSIFRRSLPTRFFDKAAGASVSVGRSIKRPTVADMIATDPTESIDSAAILPAVRELMPSATLWMLGGVIYHFGLNDILANFEFPQDEDVLSLAMGFDEAISKAGVNHVAAGIFLKP